MTSRDEIFIRRLVECIINNVDYGDISELSEELNVDEYWLGEFLPDYEEE